MNSLSTALVWLISLLAIAGVILRPRKTSEWHWAVGSAVLLLLLQLVSLERSIHAVLDGTSVYFFLIGMMLLSELAREEGLFDWLAQEATRRAGASNFKLFSLIYLAGVLTTVFLSLDATAVVLTPAVLAVTKRAGVRPTVHLFGCAMISNAASFVLPISNPANLVMYGGTPPGVLEWLREFTLPSIAAIVVTFVVLALCFKKDLGSPVEAQNKKASALPRGAVAVNFGLALVVLVMLAFSYRGMDFGLPAFVAATTVAGASYLFQKKDPRALLKSISWSVIPLVAGLFVIVEALNGAGAQEALHRGFDFSQSLTHLKMVIVGGFGVGVLSNVLNNLPVGLMVSGAVKTAEVTLPFRKALLLGVDLGPNLSVTGSLATILWLLAIRREGEEVRARDFFKIGLIAMPLAMVAALLAL